MGTEDATKVPTRRVSRYLGSFRQRASRSVYGVARGWLADSLDGFLAFSTCCTVPSALAMTGDITGRGCDCGVDGGDRALANRELTLDGIPICLRPIEFRIPKKGDCMWVSSGCKSAAGNAVARPLCPDGKARSGGSGGGEAIKETRVERHDQARLVGQGRHESQSRGTHDNVPSCTLHLWQTSFMMNAMESLAGGESGPRSRGSGAVVA